MKTTPFKREEDVTADLLTLVGVEVEVDTVIGWTDEQVQQAEDWAAAAHLKASDNNILMPPMPLFLRPFDVSRVTL